MWIKVPKSSFLAIFKQLQEVLERGDRIENEMKVMKVEHKVEVNKLNDRIDFIEKENTGLRKDNQLLKDDNERMRRIINNDSSNSSLPPSTDQKGKAANTYNAREKSGKKCGGQRGHKGTALTKREVENKIGNGDFQHRIVSFGKQEGDYISKYVPGLQILPTATELRFYADETGKTVIQEEYKSDVIYGPIIKSIAVDLYSEGAVSNDRICEFINAISGNRLNLSTGSIYGFCRTFTEKSRDSISRIREELMNSETVYTDATVVTTNVKQAYIRNQSTDDAVLYSPMEKKNIDTLKETGILSAYCGTLVHDHETALYRFGSRHGECIVHLMRYLKKNTEEGRNEWSGELSSLFSAINEERKKRIATDSPFTGLEISGYEAEYDRILLKGRSENKKTSGKYAKQEEKTLLNRLDKYKENHLLFLHDFQVGFDNSMSERDLRKCKNRQKIAGGFRKQSGNEMYCSLMSVIETCKRKKMQIFENICKILNGTPAIF